MYIPANRLDDSADPSVTCAEGAGDIPKSYRGCPVVRRNEQGLKAVWGQTVQIHIPAGMGPWGDRGLQKG